MSTPFFSIAIPTKNRPDRVGNAVRSLVEQSFGDLEVIVCDNSDESESARTAAVVERFDDPRVRYLRTDGLLSMPDNWDFAIADARGEYVGILTDRSVFRPDAMEVVHAEIQATGASLVNWYNDLYGRGPSGSEFKRRPGTGRRYRRSADDILAYFVHGDPKYSTKVIPKLMTSVCRRSVLDAIRASPVGRVCPPVAPDFTSGFLMLGHADSVLTIDESLYVSVGTGNGAEFRRGGALADRFRLDLGMEWRDFVDHMPSEACFAHALVLNDLMRVRAAVPDLLGAYDLDHPQYYLGCLNDYRKAARHGARRDEDLASLLAALEREPEDVRASVKGMKLYKQATTPDRPGKRAKEKVASLKPDPHPSFDTVFEAMAWDAENPRELLSSGLMERKPGLEGIKKARPRDAGRDGAAPERASASGPRDPQRQDEKARPAAARGVRFARRVLERVNRG